MKVQNKTSQTKATTTLVITLLLITLIASCVGMYAWAKYQTIQSGNVAQQIAKWHFELIGNGTLESGEVNLAFSRTDNYDYVAEDKVAPGTFGTLPITIDTTNTEVSLTYDLTVKIANFPKNMILRDSSNNILTPQVVEPQNAEDQRVATVTISKFVPQSTANSARIHDETIYWSWAYETGNTPDEIVANDIIDTNDQGKPVNVSVYVTGTEVLATPFTEGTISYGENKTITNGGTITLKLNDDPITLSLSSGTEGVTYSSSNTGVATVGETSGVITPVAKGTTTITVTGNQTGKIIQFTVEITKPKVNVQVGDTILYTPSEIRTYNWNQELATSGTTGSIELKSGASQNYNIASWKVLSIDDDNITMVPANPVGSLTFQGAQGYNNAVKLLNDACATLYGDAEKGITARSINMEDIENIIKEAGRTGDLETAKANVGTQKASAYSKGNSYYPTIYEREESNIINPAVTLDEGVESGLKRSEQTQFIEKTVNEVNNQYKQAGTSIQPYQTYYDISLGSTTKENLLKKTYWVASRCVYLNPSNCSFRVHNVGSGMVGSIYMFSSGSLTGSISRGLFPVVFLSSDLLNETATVGTYSVQ